MKRVITTIVCIFLSFTTYSQLPEEIENVAKQFTTGYNEGCSLSVYNLFAPEMKQAMGEEGTRNLIHSLKSEVGSIKNFTHIPIKHNKTGSLFTTVYNLEFENGYQLILSLYIHPNASITGLYLFPPEQPETAIPTHTCKLQVPFKEEWTVTWGGDNRVENYHRVNETQKYAIDMVITDENGLTYHTDASRKENYYCFGKPLFAPCDGVIAAVVNGLPDLEIGTTDTENPAGNHVIIQIEDNVFAVIAHLQQNSIIVQEGQTIKNGEFIANCGNSGNTSEPHIHFHLADKPGLWEGKGIKPFFSNIYTDATFHEIYSPIRGDKLKPQE